LRDSVNSMIGGVVNLELARHQWEDGQRAADRLRGDAAAYTTFSRRVAAVSSELTRRIGQVFTLEQLAVVYRDADRWVFEAIDDALPGSAPTDASIAADAAFHLYSRRASDYAP